MQPAIVFDGVWKKFRTGERHDSLRDLIPSLLKRTPPSELANKEFWAVHDVSFAVQPGEALGIIGPNGAGKSTTLKLLTRILRPTRGSCLVRGRVGALIEVAAGFHPDLTGRENVCLQGAIMGMRRQEIVRRLDEIIEFAGVGPFIDTPVKRYSSGMNARLGFSIAAHLDPDALIIDEVLSVGDSAFQRRCVERMQEFRQRGVTIVFVSHNLQAVSQLCSQALYLDRSVRAAGNPEDVIRAYTAQTIGPQETTRDDVRIVGTELLRNGRRDSAAVRPHADLTLRATYQASNKVSGLVLGFIVHRSTDNVMVYDANYTLAELGRAVLEAGDTITVDFTFAAHLTRGHYHVECHVFHAPTHSFVARHRPAAVFTVGESRTFAGVADLELDARIVDPSDAYAAGCHPQRQQRSATVTNPARVTCS